MITTGIPKLDQYLGGGIPKKKSFLFSVSPEVEESNLGIHVVYHNLQKEHHCVYVVSQCSPKQLANSFREFGWDFNAYRDKLTVIDGYSRLIGAPSEEKYVIFEPHDILSYEDVVDDVLKTLPEGSIVSFDSLSNIMDQCGERETLQGVSRINEGIGKKESVAIYNFTSWPYKENILYRIKRVFDGIVEISEVREATYSSQKYHLKKVGWNGNTGKSVTFKVYRPGGLKIYIPKVMVVGPFKSGKTSFMKSLCDRHTSVDRMGSTIAVEHGTIDRRGYRAEVFGIPGQERFFPLVQKMEGIATGAILVVDSTDSDSLSAASNLIINLRNRDIPVVIAANKQDVPDAMTPVAIQQRLEVPDTTVVATSAINGEGVFASFETLVELIIERGSHVE